MKKISLVFFAIALACTLNAQTDFVAGYNVIFEDHFERDPLGDFPARWNTSGDGQVVSIEGLDGKWLKISQPTAVSPALKKALPENCTVEFDLYLKSTTGVAPHLMFGLTSLSNMGTGDVYYSRRITVKLESYNESGTVVYGKNIQDLGTKKFALEGYVDRVLHVSVSLNKTRFRVYLDDQKVIDLPQVLAAEYRKNFFVASSAVIPSPEEALYLGNVRIAEGEADARSLLIKQLLEEGSFTTSDIQFNPQTNELTPQSQPLVDQLGQTLQQNPDMSIQINGMVETPMDMSGNPDNAVAPVFNKQALKLKADKIKSYLVRKFKLKMDRIITDAKAKVTEATETNNTASKAKKFLTEIVKL